MITIRVFRPYSNVWALEAYATRERAEAMVAYYRQCGSKAYIV